MTTSPTDSHPTGTPDLTDVVAIAPAASEPCPADNAVHARVEDTLHHLQQLAEELNQADHFQVPPLGFQLPADFALSIVIPVYNEFATIERILARVRALPIPKEIIVVDDGSSDGTRQVLRDYSALPDVRIILQPRNRGKGAAVRTGLQSAQGSVVVVQDADLEYDPRDILSLLQPILKNDADVVYGSRFLNHSLHTKSSTLHQFGNRALTWFSNRSTGLQLTDMETCYKVMRRDLLDGMTLRQDRFGFEPEITAKLARRGCRIVELPVRYEARAWSEGKKIGVMDGLKALYCIVRYALSD